MSEAQIARQVVAAVRARGEVRKSQLFAEWRLERSAYSQVRRAVLRNEDVIPGPANVGGFRSLARIADQVASATKERGEAGRRWICENWQLGSGDYRRLAEFIRDPEIESIRGGRRGGFRLRTVAQEQADPPSLPIQSWQAGAVDLIAECLTHQQIEGLIGGSLLYTIRKAREIRTGEDRRGSKRELASALVLKHGCDLLARAAVRGALASACGLAAPRKWHAGGPSAFELVSEIGLPPEFAGVRPPRLEPFEYFEARDPLPGLSDFQEEVAADLRGILDTPGERALLTLPTGAGKTYVAVETLRRWLSATLELPRCIVWLAHTEELCEQAYQCFSDVWRGSARSCPLYLFRFWGNFTNDLELHRDALGKILEVPTVLISTPQRILSLCKRPSTSATRMLNDLERALSVLVVDEAHRAGAPSYGEIVDRLVREHVCLIGLTATPFRRVFLHQDYDTTGTQQLRDIFGQIIEPRRSLDLARGREAVEVLQERGVLSHPLFQLIQTHTTIGNTGAAESASGDDPNLFDMLLQREADRERRRLRILEGILGVCKQEENSVLYFGPTVNDAESMAYLLLHLGVPAAVVSSESRLGSRRKAIEDFKSGRLRVLCNCEVLTTGFDAPKVTHVVVARPTVSLVLYQQMIGRGLRGPKFGGTEKCVIFDCEDRYAGQRPLGYTQFRELWGVRPRSSTVPTFDATGDLPIHRYAQ